MSLRNQFVAEHPEFPLLAVGDTRTAGQLLTRAGLLTSGEHVLSSTKAGEGNMNLTLRITTTRTSYIAKQARPWVEKYDVIAAPWERAEVEATFYNTISEHPSISQRMPELLAFLPDAKTLILEDLGESKDFTSWYTGERAEATFVETLAQYLAELHALSYVPEPALGLLRNRRMRELNAEHIFRYPLRNNGLNLDQYEPGLSAAAAECKADGPFRDRCEAMHQRYLTDGQHLLHGDYFPGSFLRTNHATYVIDPEFCFLGDPEFDLGVFIAHLVLSRQPHVGSVMINAYRKPFSETLLVTYAAIEIMRRIIGVAQLPIPITAGWRSHTLARARRATASANLEVLLS